MKLIRINPEDIQVGDWITTDPVYCFGAGDVSYSIEEVKTILHNMWEQNDCIINDLIYSYSDLIVIRIT